MASLVTYISDVKAIMGVVMTEMPKPPTVYEERLCLFLDILAFKSHIDESSKVDTAQMKTSGQQMTVSRLYSALNEINKAMTYEIGGLNYRSSKTVSQFSDSIVVSYKLDEESAVYDMLFDIYLLQINLIQKGLLVRGAITSGQLIHDGRLVFGPALNEAVELEKLAMYPRVILTQEIIELGKKYHGSQHTSKHEETSIKSLLNQDLDGMFYVNYFEVNPEEFHDGWFGLYHHLIELRDLIKRMSQLTRTSSIKIKHSWMRQKYNEIAKPLEMSRYTQLGARHIPKEHIDAFFNLSPFK